MGDDSQEAPESLRRPSKNLSLDWLTEAEAERLLLHLDGLAEDEAAWICLQLEAAPPATPEQLDRLGRILGVRFASPPEQSGSGPESGPPDPSPPPAES